MARQAGEVLERRRKRGRGYALRFHAYGERRYLTLGFERDGWTRRRAEEELQNVMADVRRGLWVAPRKSDPKPKEEVREGPSLFGDFAIGLHEARKGETSESNHEFMGWCLRHAVPYFGDWPLDEIDIPAVDEFRRHLVDTSGARRRALESGRPMRNQHGQALRPLGPSSINKVIDALQWVLSIALEYEHIARNPAIGRRRRLKVTRPAPVHLDSVEHIEALLEAAAQLDSDPTCHMTDRRAIVATLLFSGLRASELCALDWRDVDLANGRLFVRRSKTAAGLREIHLLPLLRDELARQKARAEKTGPDDPVFPTSAGGRRDKDNLRNRVLELSVRRADELLEARDRPPLPVGLTPHKLRHTFASILIATGEDPVSVMGQLGHTDPKFTLRVYSHIMRRGEGEGRRLKELVEGDAPTVPDEAEALTSRADLLPDQTAGGGSPESS